MYYFSIYCIHVEVCSFHVFTRIQACVYPYMVAQLALEFGKPLANDDHSAPIRETSGHSLPAPENAQQLSGHRIVMPFWRHSHS